MKMRNYLTVGLLLALLLSGCGSESRPAPATAPGGGEDTVAAEPAASGIGLEDGVYTVDFRTDSSMFQSHDRKGTLTVQGGQATLHVSLGSKNIVGLYPGLAADAEKDEQNRRQPTTDTVTFSDGLTEEVNGFDIPVSVLGQEFDLAIIGKKGVWYDHKVSVENPVPADTLADGRYTCQVTLSGGSGRASVASPAAIAADGGRLTATIVWSSPNYEYMVVDGVQYAPVQAEGNSTFQIPVVLDEDMAVSASTVAMSQPHLVEYTLRFDGSTLQGE